MTKFKTYFIMKAKWTIKNKLQNILFFSQKKVFCERNFMIYVWEFPYAGRRLLRLLFFCHFFRYYHNIEYFSTEKAVSAVSGSSFFVQDMASLRPSFSGQLISPDHKKIKRDSFPFYTCFLPLCTFLWFFYLLII